MRTIHFNFYSSIKTVGATVLGSLWALEWCGTVMKQTCAAQESQESCGRGTLSKQTCAAQESQESHA